MKYKDIYCPKHGFKSMDSQLDKWRRLESLEQYLTERYRYVNNEFINDQSDENYEDIDDQDLEYEMELNAQYAHRYGNHYVTGNTVTDCSVGDPITASEGHHSHGWTHKLINCFLQFWYCLSVNQEYKAQMKRRRARGQGLTAANSVSMIDTTSRILFPFVWILLNLFYWVFLIIERNSEFKM